MIFKFKVLINFFLFSFLISNLHAYVLEIKGLSKLNLQDIQSITTEDIYLDPMNDQQLNLIIKDLYNSDLIYDLSIEVLENKKILLLEEAKLINQIYINNNLFIKDEVLVQNLFSKKDTLLNKIIISKDIKLIEDIYSSQGYKNSTVNVSIENFSTNKINIIFDIYEGKKSKISKINFTGNKFFSDNYLNDIINIRSNNILDFMSSNSNFDFNNIDFDLNKIKNKYKEKGYFDINTTYLLNYDLFGNFILDFYIDEGDRYIVKDIEFNFDDKYKNIQEITTLNNKLINNIQKNNQYYDEEIIENYINDLSIFNNKKNFVNTNTIINLVTENKLNKLIVSQEIIEPITIEKINIFGNSITKSSTIRSKLLFEPGDYLNKFYIEKSKKNIENLAYINEVKINNYVNENKSILDINLIENKKTGTFNVAGFLSSDVGLGLAFNLNDKNFLGLGNELSLNISNSSDNLFFDTFYKQHDLNNPNIINSYSLFRSQKDLTSSFGFKDIKSGVGLNKNFNINSEYSYGIGLSFINSEGNSPVNTNSSVTDNITNSNDFNLSFNVQYKKLNDNLYPTDGYNNSLNFSISPTNISDNNFFKIDLKNHLYKKISKSNDFIFVNNQIGSVEGIDQKVKTVNVYSLGGLNFKGFDYRGLGIFEDGIYLGGNRYFTSTMGYGSSFLFDSKDNINFKSFVTFGSLWGSDYTSNNQFDLRGSAGIAVDILTPIAPLSISYAEPFLKNSSDIIKQFSFTLGTTF